MAEEEVQPPDIPEPTVDPDEDPGPVVDGWSTAPVSGDRVDVHLGPLVAGDPLGARVEVTATGLHAYDETGTETARIQGEGGEFVGGSFRTSDVLPGQVTLSDTGYISPGTLAEGPGFRVTPESMAGLAVPPSVGPSANGMIVSGGQSDAGSTAFSIYASEAVENRYVAGTGAQSTVGVDSEAAYLSTTDENGNNSDIKATPAESFVRNRNADGSGAMIYTSGESAELSAADAAWAAKARIKVNGREAYLWTTGTDQVSRILSVDADGIWVKTNKGGTWVHYNLEALVAPSLVQFQNTSGWTVESPTGGISVQQVEGGQSCRGRISLVRTGGPLELNTAYTTIGTVIPPELQTSAVMFDYIETTLPDVSAATIAASYSVGQLRIRTRAGVSTINTGASFRVSLEWFVPN